MSEPDINLEEHMEPDINDRIMGPIIGLLLCIVWIAVVFFIEGRLFPNQSMVNNPLISWLNIGLIPFFISAGNHLTYYRKLGSVEAARSMIALKCCLFGFAIWLIVIRLFLTDSGISYMLVDAGGYLFTIAIVLICDMKVKREYHNSITSCDNQA